MKRPPTPQQIRTATDAGRVRMLDVALRELQRADKTEAKAARAFDKKESRMTGRALSKAAKKVDDWSNVVDAITRRFERDVSAAERRHKIAADRRARRAGAPRGLPPSPAVRRRIERAQEAQAEYEEADMDAEWEFQCEYLAGESASNVDVNFRLRRNDGQRFDRVEAERAMQVFRAQLSAGLTTAPPGYRIAGIDWRRPTKSTAWTRHGQFPSDLGDLQNVLYVASDFPTLWRLGDVDD